MLHWEEGSVRSADTPEHIGATGSVQGDSPVLLYEDDRGRQRLFMLKDHGAVTIGRDEEVDVTLPWDGSVSSVHAELVRLGVRWLISDEGISRNGTFVNDQRVHGRRRLRHGDLIRVGATVLTFSETPGERPGSPTEAEPASTVSTVTVLFTDLVGSTEMLARLGDEAADRLRRAHFVALREVAGKHGGREVKSLGDGLMLVFASARRACGVRKPGRGLPDT